MSKKQVPLRLSEKLYDAIAAWAEDDFRSVNGQMYRSTSTSHRRLTSGRRGGCSFFAVKAAIRKR